MLEKAVPARTGPFMSADLDDHQDRRDSPALPAASTAERAEAQIETPQGGHADGECRHERT